jgi:translation initiation factor 2B subunit (eIF-2B alpha/beta/delta family)
MLKPNKITIAIILVAIVAMAAPASAAIYHGGQSESDKADKIVQVAENAGEKVENLIALVYVNETALEMIENANLIDDLEGNVTLFDKGTANVTAAYAALAAEDYEGTIANATRALEIFREVLKSINTILNDSDVQKGQLIDAQGLIVAMQRALDRIDRIRDLLDKDATDAFELLDNAARYLDIDTARLWLLDGKVTETAYNLTQANHLISDAHQYLKDQAKECNERRINNYLDQMYRARERCREQEQNAGYEGVDVDSVLQSLGYQNMAEFIQTLQNMAQNAQGKDNIQDTINDLRAIGQTIREMDHALTQEIGHYRAQHGQSSTGGNGGFGQGNMGN